MRASILAALPHEDPAELAAYRERCLGDLLDDGASAVETEVAEHVALLRWRLRRIEDIEARRQQAEVLHRLEDTPEKKTIGLIENAATGIDYMVRSLTTKAPSTEEDLAHVLVLAQEVAKMLVKVEGTGTTIFVGANGLLTAIEDVRTWSGYALNWLAYKTMIQRACAAGEALRSLLPEAQRAVETVKIQLSLEMPLPGDRDVALRVRYRRDIEKSLEAEMRFLMQLREHRLRKDRYEPSPDRDN